MTIDIGLNTARRWLYSHPTMADTEKTKEHVAIPAWGIAILVSIGVAGVGNIAAMSAWKGALDSKLSTIETQLGRIENLPGRVSVVESRQESGEREWRSRGEDIARRITNLEDQLRELLRIQQQNRPPQR